MSERIFKKKEKQQLINRSKAKAQFIQKGRQKIVKSTFEHQKLLELKNLIYREKASPSYILMFMADKIEEVWERKLICNSYLPVFLENQNFFLNISENDLLMRVIEMMVPNLNQNSLRKLSKSQYYSAIFYSTWKKYKQNQSVQCICKIFLCVTFSAQIQSLQKNHQNFGECLDEVIKLLPILYESEDFQRILLSSLLFCDQSQLYSNQKRQLEYYAKHLISIQRTTMDDLILLAVGCLIGIQEQSFCFENYILSLFKNVNLSYIIHFIKVQVEETNLGVIPLRNILIVINKQMTECSDIKKFLIILQKIIGNEVQDSHSAIQIVFQDILGSNIEKFIHKPLLSELGALLSTISQSAYCFPSYACEIIVKFLEIGAQSIDYICKIRLVKAMLKAGYINESSLSNILTKTQWEQLWKIIEGIDNNDEL